MSYGVIYMHVSCIPTKCQSFVSEVLARACMMSSSTLCHAVQVVSNSEVADIVGDGVF